MAGLLLLDDFFLKRLDVNWIEDKSIPVKDVCTSTTSFDYNVLVNSKDRKLFRMDLHLSISQQNKDNVSCGYVIKGCIVGIFHFQEDLNEEIKPVVLRISGVSLLYGTFRGILANHTSLFPGGKFTLPSIDPSEVVNVIESKHQQAS